jgi:putative redox protein
MIEKITIQMNDDHTFSLLNGGSSSSLNPKALLLYATAECAGLTIVGLLKEHISAVKLLEISIEGRLSTDSLVAESQFTYLNIIYRAECNTLKDQMVISRAINLAHDKYCGMLQMVQHIAPLSHEISVVTTGDTEV